MLEIILEIAPIVGFELLIFILFMVFVNKFDKWLKK